MLNKDKALWTKIHITPAPNAISGQLDAETQNDVTNLTNTHGDSFDRGYADSQVRDHKNAVDLVDKITPNVKSAAFKADLAAARPKLEAHLRMAESVQKQIEKGVTNQQPGDKGKR
jgi:predicted outer membrane protein